MSWDTTTKITVAVSTHTGSEKTYENPAKYIWVGSMALAAGSCCCNTKKAKNAPPSIFSMPGTIQPGPASSTAAHQRFLLAAVFSGKNRKKSTCSPTCTTKEKATVAAAPNIKGSNALLPEVRPDKPVKSLKACGFFQAMAK